MQNNNRKSPNILLIGALFGASTLIYWCLGLSLIFVLPSFSELFNSFGANLPALTVAVLNHRLWIGFGILGMDFIFGAFAIFSHERSKQMRSSFSLYGILFFWLLSGVSMVLLIAYAMYAPLLTMGNN